MRIHAYGTTYALSFTYPCVLGPAVVEVMSQRACYHGEARTLYQSLGTGERFGDYRAQAVYDLLCGDVDRAADWVEKALEQRDHSMMYYLRFVICKPLRASDRWPKIARMVNLPGWGPAE